MTAAITVLVGDDDADLRLLLRVTLQRAGIEIVEEAIDGPDALAALAGLASPPISTVMVLDNQMPGLTGLDLVEQVLASVPDRRIILFSAFLDPDVRQRAELIGVSRCVAKTEVHNLPSLIALLAAE